MEREDNIYLSLHSIQWKNDDKSETELITKARMSKSGSRYVITYDETKATGFEGSVTTIEVNKEKSVSITRAGTANSVLALEIGKKHFCQYDLPYGNLQIGVYTHDIVNTLDKDGKLYMKYTLDLNSSYLSDNEIFLTVKESNRDGAERKGN